MEISIQDIRAGLAAHKVSDIARETGIHRNTIRIIRDGKQDNPNYRTLRKLAAFLEARKAEQ